MEEWEEVDIEVVSSGLDATPSELHAAAKSQVTTLQRLEIGTQ